MPYMNVAPLEKAAKDAAAKVKECENDLSTRKKQTEQCKKNSNQKEAEYKTADTKYKTAQAATKKALEASRKCHESVSASKAAKVLNAAKESEKAAEKTRDQAKRTWDSAYKDWKGMDSSVKEAEKKLTAAKTAVKNADKAVSDQMKLNLRIAAEETKKMVAETAKKAADAFKKDPAGTTANAAKAVVGGVDNLVQSGISTVANTKLLQGTKVGTALEFSNSLAALPGAWKDVGIDTIAELAWGIYQGKSVEQLYNITVSAAKKSAKGSVDTVVDQAMAAIKAFDINFSKQDLTKMAKDLKKYANEKMNK